METIMNDAFLDLARDDGLTREHVARGGFRWHGFSECGLEQLLRFFP